ncbi:hypothetical protein psyc5s11_51590 [Clostridium gelidum]|uniref:Uncharacterized protein n=1 Tax=Clostridium gelidum TaxID=704125 RepID=A0ABN6J4C1_9CLOT|nr:hypothetical protein [Clostridium gelidum]BCZ49092.1 hypothetical protein psyc5s11_51590 [Clostridium gelidum]
MISEKIDFLVNMSDEEWGQYAFSRDPIKNKISYELRQEMIEKANLCGKEQALKLKKRFHNFSVKQIVEKMNLKITHKDSNGTDNYIMFACYNSPNKVTLFTKNMILVEQFIKENQLEKSLDNVDIENMLLLHEMFHHIEGNEQNIYTKTETIKLWKIGFFEYKSKLIALGEIAAMAFAKEMLSLSYNPYVFDIIMLYPHDTKKADELLDEVKEIKGGI